jgi:2-oxoisovalerate dehydrogenase E1 component beta subunit
VPSTPADAKGLIKAALRDPNPVIIFEPKKGYRSIKGDVPDGEIDTPIGAARIARTGGDVSVFAYGMMAYYAEQAAEIAAAEGIDAEVIDLRTLAPIDHEAVLASVRKTGKALIVYEDNLTLGYGAEIAALIADAGFEYLDAPVRRLAAPDVPAVPFSHPMQDFYMINPEKIAAAIRELAAY